MSWTLFFQILVILLVVFMGTILVIGIIKEYKK